MGRLLVVDDAMLMRRMIRDVALEAGWDVVGEATNGREAVSLFDQHRPDLVPEIFLALPKSFILNF